MAIPAAIPTTVVDTDLSVGEVATMTSRVDEDGAKRIMGMLIDLYSDEKMAVVREYVANAVDASIAAGSTAPVEVTTPDELTPSLIVKDRGTGMTAAEVEAVFLAFAASTKRSSNNLVGGLGVGAKSAWTCADSFIVDTVCQGRRTIVRAARDLEHQVLMADQPSDLPNGTTITIPVGVDNANRWRSIAMTVASAHKAGAVLLDGKPVASIQGGPRWVGPIRVGGTTANPNSVTVLSGGTLFGVPSDLAQSITAQVQCGSILELPIGSFDHTPSRESLIATPRTKGAVAAAMKMFKASWTELAREIAALAATDIDAALARRSAVLAGVGRADHLPINFNVMLPEEMLVFGPSSWSKRSTWHAPEAGEKVPAVHFAGWCSDLLLITGWPQKRTLRGIAKYMKEFAPKRTAVAVLRGDQEAVAFPAKPFNAGKADAAQTVLVTACTPGVQAVTFTRMQDDLASLRGAQKAARPETMYNSGVRVNGRVIFREMPLSEIADFSGTVVYSHARPAIPEGSEDFLGVELGRKSEARFTAAVPQAEEFFQWRDRRNREITAGATSLDLAAAALASTYATDAFKVAGKLLEQLPAAHPAAETLRLMASIHARSVSPMHKDRLTAIRRAAREGSTKAITSATQRVNGLWSSLTAMYPLLKTANLADANSEYTAHLGRYVATVGPTGAETPGLSAA